MRGYRFPNTAIFRRFGLEAMVNNMYLTLIPPQSYVSFCNIRQHLVYLPRMSIYRQYTLGESKVINNMNKKYFTCSTDKFIWVKFNFFEGLDNTHIQFKELKLHRKNVFLRNNSDNIFSQTEIGFCRKLIVSIPSFSLLKVKESVMNIFCGKLVKDGIPFYLKSDVSLPIMKVYITSKFAEKHLCSSSGTGIYLERHSTHHLHRPCNSKSGGYLVLGKEVCSSNKNNTIEQTFELVALSIPYGYTFITPPWVWHNDCFLSGDYEVAYTPDASAETLSLLVEP